MSLMIDDAHLEHAVRRLVKDKDALNEMLGQIGSTTPSVRDGLLKALEKLEAGVTEKLKQAWSGAEGGSYFLFRLVALEGLDTPRVRERMERSYGKQLHDGKLVKIPKPSGDVPEVRVTSILREGPVYTVNFRARIPVVTETEGDDDEIKVATRHRFHDVKLRVDLQDKVIVAEVHGQLGHATKAVAQFLEGALGQDVPYRNYGRSRTRDSFFVPVTFLQGHVLTLAKKQKFVDAAIAGPDPDERQEEVKLIGRRSGAGRPQLDTADPRLAAMRQNANFELSFNFPYVHNDGFSEVNTVTFSLRNTKHSHVKFVTRTSKQARRAFLDLFIDAVRPSP